MEPDTGFDVLLRPLCQLGECPQRARGFISGNGEEFKGNLVDKSAGIQKIGGRLSRKILSNLCK